MVVNARILTVHINAYAHLVTMAQIVKIKSIFAAQIHVKVVANVKIIYLDTDVNAHQIIRVIIVSIIIIVPVSHAKIRLHVKIIEIIMAIIVNVVIITKAQKIVTLFTIHVIRIDVNLVKNVNHAMLILIQNVI